MKTISQIAKEIGVTRQSVYRKMKQEPLSLCLQGLVTKTNNKTTVGDTGERLIKSAFKRKNVSRKVTKKSDKATNKATAQVTRLTNTTFWKILTNYRLRNDNRGADNE